MADRLAPTSAARSGGGEVVFTFSYTTWQAAAESGWFHSEYRLARRLAAEPRVRRLLMCEPVRSLPRKLVRDRLSSIVEPFPAGPDRRLFSPVTLGRVDPAAIGQVAARFAAYDRALEREAGRMGLIDPVVITTHPLVAGFAELSWARVVTFYAVDDWAEHPAYRRWWPAYREAAKRARERGRRVAAVSGALLDRLDPQAQGIVVPNAIDPAEWSSPAPAPAWAGGLSRPLLVYAGALDSRLDVAAVRRLVAEMPDASVVLVGPLADPGHVAGLRSLANVVVRPSLSRAEVAGLIRSADVGLIPHLRSRLTEAMSPLKLYEYLAAGRPVAATDLGPVRGVHPRVALASEATGFTGAVRAALDLGPMEEAERRRFVEANSWRSRHDRLLDLALA